LSSSRVSGRVQESRNKSLSLCELLSASWLGSGICQEKNGVDLIVETCVQCGHSKVWSELPRMLSAGLRPGVADSKIVFKRKERNSSASSCDFPPLNLASSAPWQERVLILRLTWGALLTPTIWASKLHSTLVASLAFNLFKSVKGGSCFGSCSSMPRRNGAECSKTCSAGFVTGSYVWQFMIGHWQPRWPMVDILGVLKDIMNWNVAAHLF
jgi:hypothetical protein